MSAAEQTYGPSALATPANFVTVLRLLISPLLFSMISTQHASWQVFAVWVILASTDGIDGWIARRHGTTRSGAFLDPLADKVLVLGAMFSLASIGRFAWLPVGIIAVREIGISLYRVYWGRRGLALPASRGGKLKTLLQGLAVGAAVMPPLATAHVMVGNALLWASVVVALTSGAHYLWAGRSAATTMQPPSGAQPG
ncbi:MAG TPA: CDP-alcohol phosphatidyltransferase family protein [Acidimicrobiales bacterium]